MKAGGDTDFDKSLANALFPEELLGINLISGSNKTRVKLLHEVLERAYAKGDLPTKFYAITDRDSDNASEGSSAVGRYQWDVYHIENYLLEDTYIATVLNSLGMNSTYTPEMVSAGLNQAARNVVPGILITRMRALVNSALVRCIDLGFLPESLTIGKDLHAAASRSASRASEAIQGPLSEQALVEAEQDFRTKIEESFANGTWRKDLPGRDILKQFVSVIGCSVGYEVLRNLIVIQMVQDGFKPVGMKAVIDQISAT